MKKFFLMLIMGVLTLGTQAQMSVSSRAGSNVIDQRDNYMLTLNGGSYQLIAKDYFDGKEIVIELGDNQNNALASILQMQALLKSAKKGVGNSVKFGYKTFNLVKPNGNLFLISEGDADYSMATYTVLVPGLKKYSKFLKDVTRMPYSVGNISKSDLQRMQKKILK